MRAIPRWGFPEVHASTLSANTTLRHELRQAVLDGVPTVAECAGLLYLCRSVDGHPMVGALDAEAVMTPRLTLAYHRAALGSDQLLGERGTAATGHEFHRTTVTPGHGEHPAWRIEGRNAGFASPASARPICTCIGLGNRIWPSRSPRPYTGRLSPQHVRNHRHMQLNLTGRSVLVLDGSAPAAVTVSALLHRRALVTVAAPAVCAALEDLALRGRLTWVTTPVDESRFDVVLRTVAPSEAGAPAAVRTAGHVTLVGAARAIQGWSPSPDARPSSRPT